MDSKNLEKFDRLHNLWKLPSAVPLYIRWQLSFTISPSLNRSGSWCLPRVVEGMHLYPWQVTAAAWIVMVLETSLSKVLLTDKSSVQKNHFGLYMLSSYLKFREDNLSNLSLRAERRRFANNFSRTLFKEQDNSSRQHYGPIEYALET